LAQAKTEAEQILANAKASAERSRESILAKAKQDVERMKVAASQDISAERDRVIAELRQRLVTLALEKAEADLPSRLDEGAQHRLVDRSIALLGG
jgi:F-type H+-transporting ATPase subunit b